MDGRDKPDHDKLGINRQSRNTTVQLAGLSTALLESCGNSIATMLLEVGNVAADKAAGA